MTSSLLHLIIMTINLIMFMLTAAVFQPYGPTDCLEYNENSQNNQGTCQRGHLCKVVSGVQGTFKVFFWKKRTIRVHILKFCPPRHYKYKTYCSLGCPKICNSGPILMQIKPIGLYRGTPSPFHQS